MKSSLLRNTHLATTLGCTLLCLASIQACFAADKAEEDKGTLTVFVGGVSGQGYRDGRIESARFSYPTGLTIDKTGAILVADGRNNVIRKITPDGIVSTVAGVIGKSGSADGKASAAEFNGPVDVAFDAKGNLYVVDSANSTLRKITPDGLVSTLAGVPKKTGGADGAGAAAQFNIISAVTVTASGNIYAADNANNTIRKITAEGVVTTLAGTAGKSGSTDGKGPAALFNGPTSVAVDADENVYVADTNNSTIRKITPDGLVSTLAGTAGQGGSSDGVGATARFNGPTGVALDLSGNVYVADSYSSTIRKISPDGKVSTLAGSPGQTGSVDGKGVAARLKGPSRIVVDQHGVVYFTDNNGQIRRISSEGLVTTVSGMAAQSGTNDGTTTEARFNYPNGVVQDRTGNLFVVDMDNGTVRKVTPAGAVSTFAGTAGRFGNADGKGADAQFGGVGSIAIDKNDNLYVAEFYGNAIRKITPDGVVSLFAGTPGKAGSADGKGAAALFSGPNDLEMGADGNLYVADFYSNTIRKITADGVVSTLAGTPGKAGSKDGKGAEALFEGLGGVAVDGQGNVYVTEMANHTIRKITPAGDVSTYAGKAGEFGAANGERTAARFNQPWGLALDPKGNLYVCDSGNNMVRKISPSGKVTTIVGDTGYYWNQPGKLPAKLSFPIEVAVASNGHTLFVTIPDAVMKVELE